MANFQDHKKALLQNLKTNKTIKAFSIYFSTTFLSKVFYFLSFIFFSHYLSKDDLGHLSIYNNTLTLLTGFVTWGVIYNLNTNFFRLSQESFRSNFKSLLLLPIINTLILSVILVATYQFTSKRFGFSLPYLWMLPAALIANFIYDAGLNVLRNKLMQKQFAYASALKLVIELLLAGLLIAVYGFGWQARVVSVIISFAVPAVLFVIYFYREGYLSGSINTKYWRSELFNFGPILIMQVCIFTLNGSDKFFLNYFDSIGKTGLFSVATNFSSIITIVGGAVYLTLIPPMYKSLAEHKNTDVIASKFYQYFIIHLFFVAGICVLIWVSYTFLLKKTFYDTMIYAYISLIGYFFWALSNFYLSIFLYLKLFRIISIISAFTIVVTLGLNYYLIKSYSILGASISIVCCNVILFVALIGVYSFILKKGIIQTNLNANEVV